jgi:hypothetical protein
VVCGFAGELAFRGVSGRKLPPKIHLLVQVKPEMPGTWINRPLALFKFRDVWDRPIEVIGSDIDSKPLQPAKRLNHSRKEEREIVEFAGTAHNHAFNRALARAVERCRRERPLLF